MTLSPNPVQKSAVAARSSRRRPSSATSAIDRRTASARSVTADCCDENGSRLIEVTDWSSA